MSIFHDIFKFGLLPVFCVIKITFQQTRIKVIDVAVDSIEIY